jgi:uncharacterized protein
MFDRTISKSIRSWFFKNEVIIVYGARQVGKTTLVEKIASEFDKEFTYLDCDELATRITLQSQDKQVLTKLVGEHKVVILDEAQRVENIGINLKILHKYCPKTQFIATGSSSFDLANKINEPLTGRNIKFSLYPLSLEELLSKTTEASINIQMEQILKFGTYPAIYSMSEKDKKTKLREITTDYLYKDILSTDKINKSVSLENLVRYLALTIGQEQSFTSIAEKIHLDKGTVERYIALLEQSFVIFRLKPLNRNGVKEIKNPFKIYFWDLGVRNSILDNYLPINAREDLGRLWENLVIIERIKMHSNNGEFKKYYFWRTNDKKEYDLIEESNGSFEVYEIKWNESKNVKHHNLFFELYNVSFEHKIAKIINKENWAQYLTFKE